MAGFSGQGGQTGGGTGTPKATFKPSTLVKKRKTGLSQEDAPADQPLGVGGVSAGGLSRTLSSFPIGPAPRS